MKLISVEKQIEEAYVRCGCANIPPAVKNHLTGATIQTINEDAQETIARMITPTNVGKVFAVVFGYEEKRGRKPSASVVADGAEQRGSQGETVV